MDDRKRLDALESRRDAAGRRFDAAAAVGDWAAADAVLAELRALSRRIAEALEAEASDG